METTHIKQGSTALEELTIGATGLVNLDDLTGAKLFMRRAGASANKVNGKALLVTDSAARKLSFDPVAAGGPGVDAFDEAGAFQFYVRVDWNDGTESRHPDKGHLEWVVEENYE